MRKIISLLLSIFVTISIVTIGNGSLANPSYRSVLSDTIPNRLKTDSLRDTKNSQHQESSGTSTKPDSKTHNWHEGTINDNDSTGMTSNQTDSTQAPH